MKKKNPAVIWIILLFVLIAVILIPLHKKPPVKPVKPVKKEAAILGRIAIVIDDWAYSLNNLSIAEKIKQPLTCAVLPNLKYSTSVMQKLDDSGFEIILHLPLEPKEKDKLEADTVTAAMDAGQIRKIFEKDLASVNLAKGVSNHMGSRITEDEKIAGIVMAEVKKHKLYFLDSFVTPKSVCPDLARKIKIRFAKRDLFLDNQNDPAYIKAQLVKLKNLARKQGFAIGIGHDRKNTLLVLKEMLPQLERQGYKFVFVSELAQ